MKKLLLLAFLTFSTISCKENKKTSTLINTEITFKKLDLIKSKPENEIIEFLKNNNYSLLKTQFDNQWKSETSDDIVQFTSKGVFCFFTYDIGTYKKLLNDLKKSTYVYFGKSMKNGVEVETYTKNKELIFLSVIEHPQNGKKVYSFTFL